MVYENALFCSNFPQKTCIWYLVELPHWGESNKYPKHMCLEVLEFVFVSSVCILLFDCIMFACFFIFLLFPFMNFRKKKKKKKTY